MFFLNKFLEFLEGNKQFIKEDLLTIVKAESPSLDKNLVDQTGEIIKDIIQKRLGADYRILVMEEKNVGNHLHVEKVNSVKPRILFLSHFDTVWNQGELTTQFRGSDLYGPGVFDMKAGLLSSIWAISSLENMLEDLPISPVFLFTSDEEIGSNSSRQLIEDLSSSCEAVFVMEPPEANTFALKTARKGVGIYRIDIEGRSAHSGNHHEDGINAILEAAYLVQELQEMTDYEKGTTINVGIIKGGSATNVVPEQATIEFDFRVSTIEEANRIINKISTLSPKNPLAKLTITGELNRPPLENNEANQRLFNFAKEAGKKLNMNITGASVGGASDGNFTSALGIPTIDGLGIPGDGPHARNEHIRFDLFTERCAFLAELCITYTKCIK